MRGEQNVTLGFYALQQVSHQDVDSLSSSRGSNQIDGIVQIHIDESSPPVAFALHGSDGTASAATSTEIAGSLRTRAPGSIENSSTTAVLQEQPVAWSGELTASTDMAGTVQRGREGGRADRAMTSQMAVRRLTPRECERSQGIPRRLHGKLASGPRYKALGDPLWTPASSTWQPSSG